MSEKPIIEEVKEKILREAEIPESEIQATLRFARERYKTELTASRDYHKQLAKHFEGSGDNQIALRQRVIAEIYESAIERA